MNHTTSLIAGVALCIMAAGVAAGPESMEYDEFSHWHFAAGAGDMAVKRLDSDMLRIAAPDRGHWNLPRQGIRGTGSSPLQLDFHPNGEGMEVDAPTDVAFSPDGQYVIVPAGGTSPGGGTLSVYNASDLSPVRVIPLTHAPGQFALMTTQPRAVLVNPADDTVTIVDYAAGTELAVVPVGSLPGAVAISPDDTLAVIQGAASWETESGEEVVPWSAIDLVSNTEMARWNGPFVWGGTTGLAAYGQFRKSSTPLFRTAGDQAAALLVEFPEISVSVVDVATQQKTTVPIFFGILVAGQLVGTPDGSTMAVWYRDAALVLHVAIINTADWSVQDFEIPSPPTGGSIAMLLRDDGSRVAIGAGVSLYILDVSDGSVVTADTSAIPFFSPLWTPAVNLNHGANFLVWHWGAGDLGYQIFDWEGAHAGALVVPDLRANADVFTQMVAPSPTDPSRIVLVDATAIGENLALLDLEPDDPHAIALTTLGDGGIEGDAAAKVQISADENTALVLNPQSSNAFFLDLQTSAKQWVDTPKYVTDATLTPDGDAALFVAGTSWLGMPIDGAAKLTFVDRHGGAAVDLALPANAFGKTLALDVDGDYVYTLLGYTDSPNSEFARIDLATQQLDANRLPVPLGLTGAPEFHGFNSDVLVLSVSLSDSRRWLAQNHAGDMLAVVSGSDDGSSYLTLIDKTAWAIITSIALGSVGTASGALMEFSADDLQLYVGTGGAVSVIAIDGADSALLHQGELNRTLLDLALSPDGSKLYLAVRPDLDIFGTGGIATHGIQVWSAQGTPELITSLQLPIQTDFGLPSIYWPQLNMPAHLWYSHDSARLYVFSVNDDVHVIDPATDEVVASMATGFLSPNSIVRLTASDTGVDPFLMTSFNNANDGFAFLTIGRQSIAVTPSLLDFGSVPIGGSAGPETVTIENTGSAAVEISTISAPHSGFEQVGGSCDTPPFTLEPGTACSVEYTFAPTTVGGANVIITFESDADPGVDTVLLTGTGVSQSEDGIFTDRFQSAE